MIKQIKIHGNLFKRTLSCCLVLFSFSFTLFAQKKKPIATPTVIPIVTKIISYEVLENGDTINKLDNHQLKQGNWLHFTEGRYGEQSYYEYGPYDNSRRVGKWYVYDHEGRTLSEENYKGGLKHGEARYYENGKLFCIGNYLALSSKYEFDTIMVEDPLTNLFKPVIVKADVGSVRHGLWTFYDSYTSQIEKVVDYQIDEVVYEKEYTNMTSKDSVFIAEKIKSQPHNSQKAPPNVWLLNKNKKPSKYTDFPDDMEYVKPNVRKEGK